MNNPITRRAFTAGAATAAITGFPHIASAQAKVIKIGMPTILSGRVAMLGNSNRAAAQIVVKAFNDAGGINGRTIELIERDSQGRPDIAAKLTRDMINNDGCEIIIDGEASSGAFAVHEVIRDLPVLCVHTCSETSQLTADPKLFIKTAFRCSRQGIHDAVAGGVYAAKVAKAKNLTKLDDLLAGLRLRPRQHRRVPAIHQTLRPERRSRSTRSGPNSSPPTTPRASPRFCRSNPKRCTPPCGAATWSPSPNRPASTACSPTPRSSPPALGDPPVLSAIHNLPEGLLTAYRYSREYPNSPENTAFADVFQQDHEIRPHQLGLADLRRHQLHRRGPQAHQRQHGRRQARQPRLTGMKLKTPLGVDGTITMRDSDHTIIGYPTAWSHSVPKAPYLAGFEPVSWDDILTYEAEWKKGKGYV